MEIFYMLLVLLTLSKLFGELSNWFGFPTILGEILAGVMLGLLISFKGDWFPVLSTIKENEVLHSLIDLGIFFLMLYAGIKLSPQEIIESSNKGIWVAVFGMIVPLLFGFLMAFFLLPSVTENFAIVLFLGISMAITAVPVAIKILIDLNLLNSKAGKIVVSSAVIDDIISLLLLAFLTSLIKSGSAPSFLFFTILVGKVALFFISTYAFGKYLLPQLLKKVFKHGISDKIEFSFLLILAICFSLYAELLGMHFIMGAFMTGLLFNARDISQEKFSEVSKNVEGITTGFLAPIFFASIGLSFDPGVMVSAPILVISLIVIATLGKLIGTYIPAKSMGFTTKESLLIGLSMNARGVVTIIIADIVLKAGLFENSELPVIGHLFSAVVLMAIITTLITPIAIRYLYK